jgi:ubiquinone/menaquinone biosynthesis C-methylase UbiE
MINTKAIDNSESWSNWWENSSDFAKYHPSARHRQRIVTNILTNHLNKNKTAQKILEVGCGTGEYLNILSKDYENIATITGTDYSEEAIKIATKKYPDIEFKHLDIEKEVLSEKYDIIICMEVIEHLNHRKDAFKNLVTMLNNNGILVVTTPAGPIFATEKHFGHIQHSSKEEMQEFAKLHNLEVSVKLWGWPFNNLLKYLTNINAEYSLKKFGNQKYGWQQIIITNILYFINLFNLSNSSYAYQVLATFTKKP